MNPLQNEGWEGKDDKYPVRGEWSDILGRYDGQKRAKTDGTFDTT